MGRVLNKGITEMTGQNNVHFCSTVIWQGNANGSRVELTSFYKRRNERMPHKEDNPS